MKTKNSINEIRKLIKLRDKYKNLVDVTFYIPCLNEGNVIYQTLSKIKKCLSQTRFSYEFLIYNDGSTDNSLLEINRFKKDNPNLLINIINLKKCRGLGYNYIDGAHKGIGKYYMMICGDNSETEDSLIDILTNMGSAEIIIPYFGFGDQRQLSRILLSLCFTKIVNLINGKKINYYNGVVLHLRENVSRYGPSSSGFGYQAELISILLLHNKTYKHISISNNDRELGISRAFKIKNFFSVAHSLLQILFRRIRNEIWPIN